MIIVLGSKGFVGCAIIRELQALGQDVLGVDLDSYSAAKGTSCEYLINAGGNSGKRLADQDPLRDFDMNVTAVLRAITDFPPQTYLHISSIDVYNDQSRPEKNEESASIFPEQLSRYGFHKWLGEQVARKHAPRCVVFRLGGMFGANSRKGPAHDILNGLPVWVSPKSRFLFLDTRTVARSMWALRDRTGEIFNLTATDNLSLEEFACLVGKPIVEVRGADHLIYRVNTAKAARLVPLPTSRESVAAFMKERAQS